MQEIKKGKAALAIPVLVFIYISVSLYYREKPSDAIDVHSSSVIKDYLDKSDFCKALAGENPLSSKDAEVLRSIKEHEESIYADLRKIEQNINCLSLPMANILYNGWAVKRYEDKDSLSTKVAALKKHIENNSLTILKQGDAC